MRIAVIGPGAMGMLFAGYLSKENEVILVGRNEEKMSQINENGVMIREMSGEETIYHPTAVSDSSAMDPVDLVLLFVKSGASRSALTANRHLIGKDTFLMTLQNGAGHESLLKEFAADDKVIIGTTKQGSYKLSDHAICHSGLGESYFGAICGDGSQFQAVADTFCACGFDAEVTDKVQGMIWNKLMINASSSVLSGVLQVAQGYVEQNAHAWEMAKSLITEICAVATADGYPFVAKEQIERVKIHLQNAPDGYTSIYADLKNGNKTEVSVINGAVVSKAKEYGIAAKSHEFIVELVKAMEEKK